MAEEGAALTAAEAATLAAVSVRTVRNWIAEGLLTATPSRRGRLVQRADLLALMRQKGLGGAEATAAPTEGAEETAATTAATTASPDPLALLVRELHEENVRLAGQVGYLQRQVVEYQERILLLTAGEATPPESGPIGPALPDPVATLQQGGGLRARLGRWWRGGA